jgi:CO/xanthine dehydrogenase Mo-binding subunit
MAAMQIRDKLAKIAAKQLNVLPDDIEFVDGKVRSRGNPDNSMPFGRVAGTAHWSPAMLPDVDRTRIVSAPAANWSCLLASVSLRGQGPVWIYLLKRLSVCSVTNTSNQRSSNRHPSL